MTAKDTKTISNETQKVLTFGLFVLVIIGASVTFLQTAWVSDDAFITFRVIDNTLLGYGPNWNPGERVQVFTHPLWYVLLTSLTAVFGDPYYAAIAISYLLTLASGILIFRSINAPAWHAILALATLFFSRSFVDYSSSGLENPLVHMLLALFALAWLNRKSIKNPTLVLTGISSALFLSRPDSIVLVFPALAIQIWEERKEIRKIIPILLLGLTPALVWISFSILYYGSPVPNTAIAKLQTGISHAEAIEQAWNYISWSIRHDRATIALLIIGIALGITDSKRNLAALALGIIAWITYLFYIGSDYMGGRFLSAPLIFSTIIIGNKIQDRQRSVLITIFLVIIASSSSLKNTIFSPSTYNNPSIEGSGISDERGFYYPFLGFLPTLHHGTWQTHPWILEGQALRSREGWYTRCAIGMTGYAGGQKLKWVDPLALTDGFLARIPARNGARVGHYERAFPDGYLETVVSGENKIKDPTLGKLYDDVRLVTQGSLLQSGRLAAIWRLNTDRHQANRAKEFDRNAIGLPGSPPRTFSKFSCYGIPYGSDGIWAIDTPPLNVRRVEFN